MCGKFTQMMSWRELHDLSDLVGTRQGFPPHEIMIGTPMRMSRVIHLDEAGARANSAMRCGFVDRRAKSPLERPKHMHARTETVDTLPTFADAFAYRRGILLTKTFNVGQELASGKVVQHTIAPRDGKPIAIAVIWERWENRSEGSLLTFVMVTTPPNALIATVTDRMPAIVTAEHWPLWLGETNALLADVKSILMPFEGNWDMAEQIKPEKQTVARPAKVSQPGLF
jgi:putative SOS response-associated peptidase YedK